MDGDRIVDLLKHLSSSSPRRGALRWLAASSLGGAFAQLLGLDSDVAHARRRVNRHAIGSHHRDRVEADRKKKKKKKKKPEQAPPAPQSSTPPPSSPPPPPPQCQEVQATCSNDCCGGLTCGDNNCVFPAVCCSQAGASCSEDCDCCDFLACQGGSCACPNDCGTECNRGNECCISDDCAGDDQICVDGFCWCDPGVACDQACCDIGSEVCAIVPPDLPTCQGGGCPATDYCADHNRYRCANACYCATSIDDTTVCAALYNFDVECVACTSDTSCRAALGVPAVCLPNGASCSFCPSSMSGFCVPTC